MNTLLEVTYKFDHIIRMHLSNISNLYVMLDVIVLSEIDAGLRM